MTPKVIFSHNQEYDFVKVDSLIEHNYNISILDILNDYQNYAINKKDTLALINTYDLFAKYFEKDTANNNEKKFLLQKIQYLKKYSHYHKIDITLQYNLYNTYQRLAYFYEQENEFYVAIDINFRMLSIAQYINDKKLESETNRIIGTEFHYLNKFSKAISYLKVCF